MSGEHGVSVPREEYPGQSDEIPVFVPRGTVEREAPEWLRGADPLWYRTEAGPVLDLHAGGHHLVVRSAGRGWTVALDGMTRIVGDFPALLGLLATAGEQLGPHMGGAYEPGVEVATALPRGFAADLLWWCPDQVWPVISGIVFDDWYGAPATEMPDYEDATGVWEYLGSIEWEMREGYSMTVSEGKPMAGRIGARFVTWDDLSYQWKLWTSNDCAREFLTDWAYGEFLNYSLDIPGEPGESCWWEPEE